MKTIVPKIPLDQCKDGYLYIINARNAKIGVFSAVDKGFKISRTKFKSNFIFVEYHWDTGAPFGTVKPLKEIGPVDPMEDAVLLTYLNNKMISLKEINDFECAPNEEDDKVIINPMGSFFGRLG